MTSAKTIVVGLLAIISIAGCSTIKRPASNEPVFQGRKLTEWLRDFDDTRQPQKQELAAEAVRHIGSAGVPFLVEQLSDAKAEQFKVERQKWSKRQATAVYSVPRPPNPRNEALSGLDPLGSAGVTALPVLGKLIQDNPPDVRALYIAARIGPDGVPLLMSSLTNEVKIIRLAARVCLEMINTHSEVLYPQIPVGPDAPSFDRRICEFNLKVIRAAFQEYKTEHPESFSPDDNMNSLPPPMLPK